MIVMMKRYLKPVLAVCLLIVLVGIFFARQVGANPLNADAKGPLTFSGTLEARQTRIAPEVGARVNAVRVKKGDQVKAGDLLLELDDATVKTTLSEAESAVRAAQASLDQVKEPARSGAVALAEAGVAQAQAELKAAQAALDDANRTLQLPQDLLTQLHIWEGKVEASKGEVGQAEAILAGGVAVEVPTKMEDEFQVRGHSLQAALTPRTKAILRNAVKRLVPDFVLEKPKQGFSIPMKHWLRTSLKPMMLDLLSSDSLQRDGYFNHQMVSGWIQEHLDGRANHSHRLWSLMVFEMWHKSAQRVGPTHRLTQQRP